VGQGQGSGVRGQESGVRSQGRNHQAAVDSFVKQRCIKKLLQTRSTCVQLVHARPVRRAWSTCLGMGIRFQSSHSQLGKLDLSLSQTAAVAAVLSGFWRWANAEWGRVAHSGASSTNWLWATISLGCRPSATVADTGAWPTVANKVVLANSATVACNEC
jgi:hypothetical protein